MKNIVVMALIVILLTSLGIIDTASAIFTPAVPQFTIKITNHTYDDPTTTQVNQYTGETTTLGGTHYEWKTIDISVTNQANQPDSENSLRYNIRYKGQYTDQWTQESGEGSFYPQNSSSSTTEYSYYLQGNEPGYPGATSSFAGLPDGTKISFQVQALWGYDDYDFTYGMRSYSFKVTSSSRSDIKTITLYSGEVTVEEGTASITTAAPVITISPTTNPTTAPTQNPTAAPTQMNTEAPAQPEVTSTAGLTWKDIVIVAAFAVIAALAVALVLTRRKKV
jgi:hypothetical protein